jgi:glycosyltransferase involved in cell wall biosynthesis
VDTGSTDNTKSIALEFVDKVYDYEWCSDFAVARNFSISKATNDWILVPYADEYVSEFSRERTNILEDSSGDKSI